jgi:DNA adenine methylase
MDIINKKMKICDLILWDENARFPDKYFNSDEKELIKYFLSKPDFKLKQLIEAIKNIKNIRWIVSYDNVPEIKDLYSDCSCKEYSFKHTVYNIRTGKEVLFFSPNLKQPKLNNWNPLKFKKQKTTGNILYIP